MNMESYSRQLYGIVHTPYNLGITQKNNQVDQKTSMFKVMPGHHISIYVQPKIVDASDEFKLLPLFTRNCKLPQETQGFNFLNEYSRKGCELECAVQNNCSYHMEKLMPGVEKLLGKLLIPEGKLFDSEGESCFSERSEAKHSPEESKSLPEGIKSA